jgi:hypothetical protein
MEPVYSMSLCSQNNVIGLYSELVEPMKITVSWDVTVYNLIDCYDILEEFVATIFSLEETRGFSNIH